MLLLIIIFINMLININVNVNMFLMLMLMLMVNINMLYSVFLSGWPERCEESERQSGLYDPYTPGSNVGRWVTSSSPQSTVSCRSLPPANPLPAVWPPWAPSRHSHSPPRQRPTLVARLRCLPQQFVPCRRVAVEGRSHPSANFDFSRFAVALPSTFCDFHVRRLSFVIVWASL